jgi:RNA polymerase sigma-70 factor (ECF subfamily)
VLPFLDLIDNEQDKKRFIYCYYQYRNLLYKIAFERLNDAQLAEDAVQETYLYIAKNFHKIEDEKSPQARNYIRLIARTYANRFAEKQDKYVFVDEEKIDYFNESGNIEDDVFEIYDVEKLANAINQLNEKYKIPIMLKCIYNHRSKEIAKLMGLSDDAVRRRVYLGKKKLKQILKGDMVINE